MPDPARLGITGHAPTVVIGRAGEKTENVGCPYPPLGAPAPAGVRCSGLVPIVGRILGDQITIVDYQSPRKCPVCERFFKLAYRVQVYGLALPPEGGQ